MYIYAPKPSTSTECSRWDLKSLLGTLSAKMMDTELRKPNTDVVIGQTIFEVLIKILLYSQKSFKQVFLRKKCTMFQNCKFECLVFFLLKLFLTN